MVKRRRILSVIMGVVFVFALPGDGKSATDLEGRAERFVLSLARQAVESLTSKGLSHEVRIKRFRKIFNENFAVRAIGKFVLGRHWAKATDAEREEYLFLFEDLMVVSYVDRFQRYTGEKLRIVRTRPERANAASVFTVIRQNEGLVSGLLEELRIKTKSLKSN